MGSRFWYLILLAGINFIEVCIMADKRAGKITANGYDAEWSSDKLIEFQNCICNAESQTCIIDVDCCCGRGTVGRIEQEKTRTGNPVLVNKYVCIYDYNWWRHIHCRRQILSDSTDNGKTYNIQCQEHCLEVIVKNIDFTFDDKAMGLRPGLCTQTTRTPPDGTSTYLNVSYNQTSESGNVIDNHTFLITWVVVGTSSAVAVIAVCAVVVLFGRKRYKRSENISTENHVSSGQTIPIKELSVNAMPFCNALQRSGHSDNANHNVLHRSTHSVKTYNVLRWSTQSENIYEEIPTQLENIYEVPTQ